MRIEGAEEERPFVLSCGGDDVEERLSLGSEESNEEEEEAISGMGSESDRLVVGSTDDDDEEEKMEESAVADREKPLNDPVLKEGETEYRLSSGRRAK